MSATTTTHAPVALITGASRGLGAELARFLAPQGYDLLLSARRPAPLRALVDEIRAAGGRATALPGDVADAAWRKEVAARIAERGGLDLLWNNASTLGPLPLRPLSELSEEELRAILEVNLIAPLALLRQTLPALRARGGLVVNLSSDAARGGYPGWGGYGASKAALDLASATLGAELAAEGVAVVSVDPGDMRTDMHQDAFPDEDISDRPLPEATLPFWAWLLGQEREAIRGRRFRAQGDRWEVAA